LNAPRVFRQLADRKDHLSRFFKQRGQPHPARQGGGPLRRRERTSAAELVGRYLNRGGPRIGSASTSRDGRKRPGSFRHPHSESRWGRLIAAHCARPFFLGVSFCRVQGRLRSRHRAAARWVFARVGPPKVDDALGWFSGAPHQAGWSGPRPGRDVGSALAGERYLQSGGSGCQAGGPVEELAGAQHSVHHDCELPGHRNSSSLEADPLLELKPP
jgi:hypothetical protein